MSDTPVASPAPRLSAAVALGGRSFTFELHGRALDLGEAGTVRYFWMDSRAFRQQRGQALAPNYAACLGHWWAAMRSRGWAGDLDQQVHLVVARCYPLVCQAKALQDVYRDAHLAPAEGAEGDGPPALGPEAQAEVRAAVARRDRAAVKQLLDEVFERREPPARELPAFQKAFQHWVGNGVVALRKDGLSWRAEPGSHLAGWLRQVGAELASYRRRAVPATAAGDGGASRGRALRRGGDRGRLRRRRSPLRAAGLRGIRRRPEAALRLRGAAAVSEASARPPGRRPPARQLRMPRLRADANPYGDRGGPAGILAGLTPDLSFTP